MSETAAGGGSETGFQHSPGNQAIYAPGRNICAGQRGWSFDRSSAMPHPLTGYGVDFHAAVVGLIWIFCHRWRGADNS